MTVINHEITEEQLRDLFDAGIAVFSNDPIYRDRDAVEAANDYAYGVFRNLFTPDGYSAWLINRAKSFQKGIQ